MASEQQTFLELEKNQRHPFLNAVFNGVVVGSEIVRLLEEEKRCTHEEFIQDLASCKGNGRVAT